MRVISDPFALDPYIAELKFTGSSVPQTYAPSAVFSLSMGFIMSIFLIRNRTAYDPDGSMQAPINSHTLLR